MSNERIARFALEGKVEGKQHIGMPKILCLLSALKRCGLNLGEVIETIIVIIALTGRHCVNMLETTSHWWDRNDDDDKEMKWLKNIDTISSDEFREQVESDSNLKITLRDKQLLLKDSERKLN